MNWTWVVAPSIAFCSLCLALWVARRDRAKVVITFRRGRARDFGLTTERVADAAMLAIRVTNKGRRAVGVAPTNPVQLVTPGGDVLAGFDSSVVGMLADMVAIGPTLAIPDTKRNLDDFYAPLAYDLGRPSTAKLGEGEGFTVLVSREMWHILRSGTAARCVEVRVFDDTGRVVAHKRLPPDLARWFNDEYPFLAVGDLGHAAPI